MTGPDTLGQDGPTVILIGGPITADDGTTLDSRQPMDGDLSSEVIRSSLAGSLLWWITATSVVSSILDSAADDAFALIIGNRSVTDLRQDGTLKRTSLRSFLPGATTNTELIRSADQPLPARYTPVPESPFGHVNGTLGVDRGQAGRRWRFFNGNDFYLPHTGPLISPAVIIDTSKSLMDGAEVNARQLENLHHARFLNSNTVLVLPQARRAQALITAHHQWTARRWYGPSGAEADAPVGSGRPTRSDALHRSSPQPCRLRHHQQAEAFFKAAFKASTSRFCDRLRMRRCIERVLQRRRVVPEPSGNCGPWL